MRLRTVVVAGGVLAGALAVALGLAGRRERPAAEPRSEEDVARDLVRDFIVEYCVDDEDAYCFTELFYMACATWAVETGRMPDVPDIPPIRKAVQAGGYRIGTVAVDGCTREVYHGLRRRRLAEGLVTCRPVLTVSIVRPKSPAQ